MPQPEPYRTSRTWDQQSSGETVKETAPSDLSEVARTLATHGGWEGSLDLALDLVLNEVVEQARLSTGATGAAIALARSGEMECRATTGGDAPELGAKLETNSGLSGACLQSGSIQLCADTETDSRVNAAATRRMGVRSILVVPLASGSQPFGILEVFSSRANAFGDRDISTLQALARRVVENKRKAEQVAAAVVPNAGDPPKKFAPEEEAKPKLIHLEASDAVVGKHDAEVVSPELASDVAPRRFELSTTVLGVLVIVVAILLGLAMGWRAGIGRGSRVASPEKSGPPAGSGDHSANVATDHDVSASTPIVATSQAAAAAPKKGSGATPEDAPTGGLQVTENGKVIYRLPPAIAGRSSAGGPTSNRLIHRVDPEYPAEAKTQKLQGAVTLDVQIGTEGAVHTINVVKGEPILAAAAVQAVRQWRYQPYMVNGRAVEMQTRVTINFKLPQT